MPLPTLSDVHVDRPLSNLSVKFLQDETDFVAMDVFPGVPVSNRSDLYFIYNEGDFFRDQMQKRAPGTPAAGGGYRLATQQYACDVWAELKIVDDQIRANSDSPLQPDRDATQWLTQQALVNREKNFAKAYFDTGLWGTTETGVDSGASLGTTFLRWNLSGSTPIEDILRGRMGVKKATGKWPNVLVLGATAYSALLTNGEIIDRLKYGQTAPGPVVVDDADLAALFKVQKVRVMSAIETTSVEGAATDTFDFIGGKHALLAYAAPSPGIDTPSAGYTFNWTGLTGATAAGMRIKKYRWEINSADHVEIDSAYAMALVARNLGYFYYTCVD